MFRIKIGLVGLIVLCVFIRFINTASFNPPICAIGDTSDTFCGSHGRCVAVICEKQSANFCIDGNTCNSDSPFNGICQFTALDSPPVVQLCCLTSCKCDPGFIGTQCNVPTCSGLNATEPLVCSGHGTCNSPNNCTCKTGFTGAVCDCLNQPTLVGCQCSFCQWRYLNGSRTENPITFSDFPSARNSLVSAIANQSFWIFSGTNSSGSDLS